MPISWNEIRQNAIRFTREWPEESREDVKVESHSNVSMSIPLKKSAGGVESNGMPSRAHYKRVRSVRGAVRRLKPTFSAQFHV